MNRTFCRLMLTAAVVLGLVRLADLCAFTDADGFCTLGSAWFRYAFAAVLWALLFLVPGPKRAGGNVRIPARGMLVLLAVLSVAAGGWTAYYAASEFLFPSTVLASEPSMRMMELVWFALRLAAGAGWLVFAAWCAVLSSLREPLTQASGTARALGYFAWLPFLMLALTSYGVSHPSAHRILYIVPVFAYVSAALLASKMLGLICISDDASVRRGAAASGILCFFLCTCVYLPQSVVTLLRGMSDWQTLVFQALPLGVFGCVGAALALEISRTRGKVVSEESV